MINKQTRMMCFLSCIFFRFQEIVPLNAGNVLVSEDNEPAVKWLALIGQALNKPRDQSFKDDFSDSVGSKVESNSSKNNSQQSKDSKGHLFQKSSLKVINKNYTVDSAIVKTCNCCTYSFGVRQRDRELRELIEKVESDSNDESPPLLPSIDPNLNYCLISSKQMVGIFLSVWVRNDHPKGFK